VTTAAATSDQRAATAAKREKGTSGRTGQTNVLGTPPAMVVETAVQPEHRYQNQTSDFFLSKNQNIEHPLLYLNRLNSSKG